MMAKNKYYSLSPILERNAIYNLIIGERSNGKTYAVLLYAIEQYCNKGTQLAYVRRWREDFKGKRGSVLFAGHVENGEITRLTKGQYDSVYYYSGRWYLAKKDKDTGKLQPSEEPFAYAFALTDMEHDKSTSYPKIATMCFDEFLTRGMYLPDEFVQFMQVVSTIVRQRNDVKIFMLGNTVNKYCPYFAEMGLKNVPKMEKGSIDVYEYGQSGLRVAVEYADSSTKKGKPSDIYFAFDNPRLQMVTTGTWEIAIYPHCPVKYNPFDILFTYFIKFEQDLLQAEIVQKDDMIFTFIHRKTTPLQDDEKDIIFSPEYSPRPNWRRRITMPSSVIEKKIFSFFKNEKVFYQDNELGEIVRNYLLWCQTK